MAEERIIPESVNSDNIIEYREHMARYQFATPYVAPNSIGLDVACGTGYGTDILSQKNPELIYGVDISKEAIQYAKAHYQNNKIKFLEDDVAKLSFPENYLDFIVSFETIEHLTKEKGEEFIRSLSTILKDNAKLIISCPNRDTYPDNYVKNPYHIYEYSFSEIKALLSRYFSDIDIYCQKIRYFKRSYKKTAQFLRHLPTSFIYFLTNITKAKYLKTKSLKKLNTLFRILLYQYHFKDEAFPFIESYDTCKPAYLVFVCKK